ncbi:hypothetical protein D9613_007512 [Agrocybe pediades]|uniref:DUF7918 domain-containing protein n=1 Tax=Agrocybe pediades TaxID=84607 RepID=A0A8H4VMP4_9AGAR|nr:hypothetical protein D9613_007512 [Agrocybe pediades]
MAAPSKTTYLSLKDFKIGIEIEGKATPHVGIETNGEKEISCWIASQAEKAFSVRVATNDILPQGVQLSLLVDGLTLMKGAVLPGERKDFSISYVVVSPTKTQDFTFASVETTDDDAYLDSSCPHKTGEIRVDLHRATYVQARAASVSSSNTAISFPEPDKVHERSKKGLDHRIKLGAIKHTKESRKPSYYITNLEDVPMASFVFKYRPLEILKATGVIPRDRTPTPPPVVPKEKSSLKRKLPQVKQEAITVEEDDSDDEERRLKERLEQIRQEKLAKKASGSRPTKRVKQEPKVYFTPGEIIDLT